jgi:glutathione S-transferase/alpha,alpha-trehalase
VTSPIQLARVLAFTTMSLSPSVVIYGSRQTRSPLVNWFMLEREIPFVQMESRPSNHPFDQAPFLTDQNGEVEVFESGAILLYLADAYGFECNGSGILATSSAIDRAKYAKWVVWANSELEKLCFGEHMSTTSLDKPNGMLDRFEEILGSPKNSPYLLGETFTVADVAVAAYLTYVPIFFPDVSPTMRPNTVRYMKRCAERPAFGKAFGEDNAQVIIAKINAWLGL